MNFWRLIKVVKGRIWMIAGVVLATSLVVLIAAPRPEVVYQADVYLQPTAQVMAGGMSTAASSPGSHVPDRGVILSNLLVLARSGAVMERTLDFIALSEDEQREKQPGWRVYKQIPRVEVDGKPVDYSTWREVLDVQPVYNPSVGREGTTTDVIRMTITLSNPEAAPYVVNAAGHAFAEVFREKSQESTTRSAAFLESSLNETKSKLELLQDRIAAYKSERKVVSVDAETGTSLNALASLEAQRESAVAEVKEAEAALANVTRQLKSQPLVQRQALPADMSPTVVKLKEELADAEADLQSLALRYRPAHPTYVAAQERIAAIKQRIATEGANYAPPTVNEIHRDLLKQQSNISFRLATSQARLASLNASVQRAQAKIGNLAQAEPDLINMMTEYAQLENSYKMISDKLAQTRIAEKETSTTGAIIPLSWAPIMGSQRVVRGLSPGVLLVYALFLSLVFSVALAVWLDSIDNRLRNAADVEQLLALPVLGLTPKLTGRDGSLPKLTHMYPLSAMAESYKILRTNLLFAMRDDPFKTLMVATGRPGQGATTTICNLAIALAQIGKRIILIDADMRRPSLHKFFGVPNEAGLSTLLQGTGNVTDAFQTTDIENLILVPAGPQPLNPSELIGSDRMREVVERLEEHCDLVMFDTPSTIVFSDGPLLASWIDAVLMVVSANQAPRGTETVTRDLLRRANARILGVVVNRMSPENVDSCYFYSHYYADSVPKPHAAEIGPAETPVGKPKAISAASTNPARLADDDNPFPD